MADGTAVQQENFDALLQENRTFPPLEDFRCQANAGNAAIYERAAQDPEAFWVGEANRLDWFKPWDKVLEWNVPWAKWFLGGQLNVTHNCVDR
ncbi:MAG TPA: acetyl-coenzyme A synthetase N-terminal domain-containing protein, partial [Terriglobia bacterium]|nr:acetyl-coenzyme A synthetase N-terminal domain-containing protein [Terriglobia bacterium]